MKKYRWNKQKFINNILKLLAIIGLVIIFDAMFLYAFFK